MSVLRVGAATLLAVVAALAALLAADVRSWRNAIAQGDALYVAAPHRASWAPSTRLAGAASAVLGVDDDVRFRRALQLYATAASTPDRLDTAVELATLRSQAETALAGASRGRHASQVETLLGVLAYEETASGDGVDQADAAIADFTNAVRADPANAAAKFDLELMLRLTAAHGSRPGAGPAGSFGTGGRRGAGGGVPGTGY
jgi:hypothetical protein